MTAPFDPRSAPAPQPPRRGRSVLRGLVADAGAAWTLLTRLPWPFAVAADSGAVARAAWALPLAGAAVGALGGAAYWLAFNAGIPALAAAALALGVLALVTGALHEDGLADFADGCGGGRTREAKLAIMRDSRIGSFGVVALLLVTAARLGALAALGGATGAAALVASAALARGTVALPMALLPPARADGLGRAAGRAAVPVAALALVLGAGIATVLALIAGFALPAAGAAVALAIVAAAAVGALALRHLGGGTGDVYGAAIQLAEAAALVALAAGR